MRTQAFDKDFYDSYSGILPTLRGLGYLSQVISALTEYGVIHTWVFRSVQGHFPKSDADIIAHCGAVVGTLFIEVGLRKFLPFSFKAIFDKRFKGMHFTLSMMLLTATVLLLATSGLVSFYGSRQIVAHYSPTPKIMSDSALTADRDLEHAQIHSRYALDSTLIQRRYAHKVMLAEAVYNKSLAAYKNPGYRLRSRLEAEKSASLAIIGQQQLQALATALQNRESALYKLQQRFDRESDKLSQRNYKEASQAANLTSRQGNYLGTFTLVALVLLLFCIAMEVAIQKGSGISGRNRPGILKVFFTALFVDLDRKARSWVHSFFKRSKPKGIQPTAIKTVKPQHSCSQCHTAFERRRKDQKFCSSKCRFAYHAAKHQGERFHVPTYQKVKATLNGIR